MKLYKFLSFLTDIICKNPFIVTNLRIQTYCSDQPASQHKGEPASAQHEEEPASTQHQEEPASAQHQEEDASAQTGRLMQIAVVGNGPLKPDQHSEINGANLVVRFNDMKNMKTNDKVDYMIARTSGYMSRMSGLPPQTYSPHIMQVPKFIFVDDKQGLGLGNLEKSQFTLENMHAFVEENEREKAEQILEHARENIECIIGDTKFNQILKTTFTEELKQCVEDAGFDISEAFPNVWKDAYTVSTSKSTTGFVGLLYLMEKYPGASFHVYGMNWNFHTKDGLNWKLEKHVISNCFQNVVTVHETENMSYGDGNRL